ncbi:uncharacterized protein [Malus domestica]|uniref:uncharacterized protein n=1 Tax=Malus domestica TaxID=3750 RepID=UPI00397533AD
MAHANLMNNYFNPNSVYTEEDFKRRFRMRHHVFERLLGDVQQVNPYFRQKRDRAGRPGFSPHQKVTVALRMMAYGSSVDSMDETHRSLDCMHWDWKNCPTGWQRGFSGRSRKPTVVLEAVASYDTWIWHAFFGVPGSQNNITIFGRSPLFNNLTKGKAPQLDYYINGREYSMGYYLADGIYPKWATLVQAIPNPRNDAEKLLPYTKRHTRKMLRELSVFYKHGGRSSANRQEGGVEKI